MAEADERQTIDAKPLARLLGCDDNTVYRAIQAGNIPAIRISPRRVVIPLWWVHQQLSDQPAGEGD